MLCLFESCEKRVFSVVKDFSIVSNLIFFLMKFTLQDCHMIFLGYDQMNQTAAEGKFS
jgi:hypothetical protein